MPLPCAMCSLRGTCGRSGPGLLCIKIRAWPLPTWPWWGSPPVWKALDNCPPSRLCAQSRLAAWANDAPNGILCLRASRRLPPSCGLSLLEIVNGETSGLFVARMPEEGGGFTESSDGFVEAIRVLQGEAEFVYCRTLVVKVAGGLEGRCRVAVSGDRLVEAIHVLQGQAEADQCLAFLVRAAGDL
jgi:hypothetical protein